MEHNRRATDQPGQGLTLTSPKTWLDSMPSFVQGLIATGVVALVTAMISSTLMTWKTADRLTEYIVTMEKQRTQDLHDLADRRTADQNYLADRRTVNQQNNRDQLIAGAKVNDAQNEAIERLRQSLDSLRDRMSQGEAAMRYFGTGKK